MIPAQEENRGMMPANLPSTALPQPVSTRRLLWGFIVLMALLVLYLYIAHRLSIAQKTSLTSASHAIRQNPWVVQNVPRAWRLYQLPHLDLYQHYFFYIPFGMFAGVLASLARQWRGAMAHRIVFAGMIGFALGWTILEEWAQVKLPDRSADWSDLFAGWGGIVTGVAIYLIHEAVLKRRRERLSE